MSNQSKDRVAVKTYVIKGTTLFGEIGDITPAGAGCEDIDSTTRNNPGGYTTSFGGWKTSKELKMKVNDYGGTEQANLYALIGVTDNWLVVYPVAFSRADSFVGYVKDVQPATPMKGAVATFDITVKVSGPITPITSIVTGLTTPFLSVTDQGSTALSISPAAANATYDYLVTTDLADTGIKVTATNATVGETIAINGTIVASGVASGAITIGTTASDEIMVPVVIMANSKVPKIYYIRVIHGSV